MKNKKTKSNFSLKPLKLPANLNFQSLIADVQGCGTIRVMYPYMLLNHFMQKGLSIRTGYNSFFVKEPDYYKSSFMLQIQRGATKQHLDLFKYFINGITPKTGTRLIYEIDDLLMGIPEWNFAYEYYSNKQEYIKEMLSIVHGITVSTEPLKRVYSEFNSNIMVIPNHLPKFIWGDIYPKHDNNPKEKKPRIFWGGSANHHSTPAMKEQGIKGGDFSSGLLTFIKKTTDKYQWVFAGSLPNELQCIKDRIEIHGWSNVFNYPKFAKSLDADFCVAPLMDNLFNECKSNIKALEFVACGCPAVYSDVYPYKDMSLKADNDDEFISHIERLADDISFRKRVFKKDYDRVRGQLFWEENGNIKNYINSYLKLFKQRLP